MNLTTNQSRRLQQHKRILIVLPCRSVPTYLHLDRPIMDWGLSGVYQDDDGQWWLDVQTDVDDNTHERIYPPHQPGDVVPIYSGRKPFKWVSWGDAVVESVECRLVNSITTTEAKWAGFDGSKMSPMGHASLFDFTADWSRRYRKPEYAFGLAWGWFYLLRLEK